MTEPGLSVTTNTLRREVAVLLGWPRAVASWSNTNLQDFDDIALRALRMFYYPPTGPDQPRYEWSFMRKTGTVTLNTNTTTYTLPDDFGGTILDDSVTYAAGQNKRPLGIEDETTIRRIQSSDNQTGVPKYYAVRNKAHDAVNGQRWEMIVYPTPTAAENNLALTYRYVFVPDSISNTNIYPVGGAQYGETITAAFLAAAEARHDDDPAGPLQQKFVESLSHALRSDQLQKDAVK